MRDQVEVKQDLDTGKQNVRVTEIFETELLIDTEVMDKLVGDIRN